MVTKRTNKPAGRKAVKKQKKKMPKRARRKAVKKGSSPADRGEAWTGLSDADVAILDGLARCVPARLSYQSVHPRAGDREGRYRLGELAVSRPAVVEEVLQRVPLAATVLAYDEVYEMLAGDEHERRQMGLTHARAMFGLDKPIRLAAENPHVDDTPVSLAEEFPEAGEDGA